MMLIKWPSKAGIPEGGRTPLTVPAREVQIIPLLTAVPAITNARQLCIHSTSGASLTATGSITPIFIDLCQGFVNVLALYPESGRINP